MPYPIPENEADRLDVLRGLDILDTRAEPRFDTYTRAACEHFNVPMAQISLVDDDRQWFKSSCGLDCEGTPRHEAFCAFALISDDVIVIEDATKDDRFVNYRLVVRAPHVRFYAGAPLVYRKNIRLGTLCISDDKPRTMSAKEVRDLARMADAVSGEIWAWRTELERQTKARG